VAKHFTNSRLLICEGNEECALVNELVKQGLIGTPDVIAIDAMSTGGGVTGIRRLLEVIQVDGTFSIVDSIGIVVDSDASQIDMFSYISGEILAANRSNRDIPAWVGASRMSGDLVLDDPVKASSRGGGMRRCAASVRRD